MSFTFVKDKGGASCAHCLSIGGLLHAYLIQKDRAPALCLGEYPALPFGAALLCGLELFGQLLLRHMEFTAPFALLLLLVTLWRCNDCRASRLLLIGQCLPLVNLLTLVYLTVRERAVRPARRYADHRPVERDQEPVTVRWSEAHRHIA